MDLQILKNSKISKQLFALLLLIIAIGIFVNLLGILFAAIFVDGNIFDRIQEMTLLQSCSDLSLMKYFQMMTQIGFFILPALLFGFLVNKSIASFFRLQSFPPLSILLLGIIIILLANPFNDWLIYQNNLISLPDSLSALETWMRDAEQKATEMTNIFLDMHHFSDYLINIFMIGILAAIGEELLLRGIFQPMMIKAAKNAHIGIWIAAFVFSFIHLQFYGFFARLFMGAILGYLFYYSNNLWLPIIIHFVNNSAAVSYVYFTNTPLYSLNQQQIEGETPSITYALLSLIIVIVGIFFLRIYYEKLNNKKT